MRSDIIEVFDLQAACKQTASERKSAGGGACCEDERNGQQWRTDRRGEIVVGMRTIFVRITADGLGKSEIWKSGTFANTDFISQKALTGVGFFLESLSLKSAVYRPERNSVPHLDLHLSPSLVVYVSLWGSNQSPPSINHFNTVSYLTGLLLSWLW